MNSILPRWLSLKEAALYSHIGKSRLVQLAIEGRIKGFQDPDSKRKDWIFDRLSLDDYREGQVVSITAREKAIAIMKGIRL